MKNTIFKAIFAVLSSLMMLLVSCANNNSIVGYYTPEKINTVIYFAPDGKIYENYASESVSCYEVSGNSIKMFIEGEENVKMEFKLTRTESGIKIGDAVYTRIDDPKAYSDNEENGESDKNDIDGEKNDNGGDDE